MTDNQEIPTINPKDFPEESELFERVKNISMHGRYTFGVNPKEVEKIILPYKDEKGYPIHGGKFAGILYQIEPAKQFLRMGDEFQYRIFADGREFCSLDDVLIGYIHGNDVIKVKTEGLAQIIKEINPNSKII